MSGEAILTGCSSGCVHFGYTPERNPWSMLLEGLTSAAASSAEKAP
jgi:hypothetical protein